MPQRLLEGPAIADLRQSFQELVDAHYDALWPYVSYLTGGAAEAEDILHQAFLAAFDRLAQGRGFTGDVGAWLRETARNLVYGWWRKQRRMPQAVADHLKSLIDDADDALTTLERREAQAALDQCLDALPPRARDLVVQRYEQGRRITDIARELERKASAVRVQLFRIRQQLKDCVEGRLADGGVPV